jgi:UDP-N-acetylglucosamine--N-acetylmuramyl-(pentapeptide) pyrophosphoryl-undecaprenol N-acetylglucosamine transferase
MADTGGTPLVVLAAGGTGGHLFPAEALAVALARHGIAIELATDERATRYGADFPARATHIVPSATFRANNPVAVARTLWSLGHGVLRAYALLGGIKPAAVVGFGGYPTIPPVAAATLRGIPTVIHDSNAVLGRANKLLAPRVTAIAITFPGVVDDDPKLAAKATRTGNPVRPAVVAAASVPFATPAAGGRLNLLVFGGSQGARVMADVVPPAIEHVPTELRPRLSIVQQARDEDIERVRSTYARLGVAAEIAPFFSDLPARMAQSHLVISRSGASTVAELAAVGRPAILVPLPHALDQDQLANATVLERAGGAVCLRQDLFTPNRLAAEIAQLAAEPVKLAGMAEAAKSAGTIDAAERLAALVIKVAGLATGPR